MRQQCTTNFPYCYRYLCTDIDNPLHIGLDVTTTADVKQIPPPQFLLLIIAMTIPVPAGYFMPMFIYGKKKGQNNNDFHQCKKSVAYCTDFIFKCLTYNCSVTGSCASRAGAVLGRLVGELLALAFPAGISTEGMAVYITPGAYALAGVRCHFAPAQHHGILLFHEHTMLHPGMSGICKRNL